jgi:HEPN domain-containing protein
MHKMTAEWVRKAEADYQLAAKLARYKEPWHDQLCFHCQQSAEKYLKALLQEQGQPVPRTHNLLALRTSLLPSHSVLRRFRRGLEFLSRFAIGPRYPSYDATRRQARAALRWAGEVRAACRTLLRLPTSQPRRRRPP